MSAYESLPGVDNGLLRFLTCGNVDDGKSTLIGRLLYDSKAILADTLSAMERTSQRRGADTLDLSLLTDGLQAEREQGITIDVAYRYFSSGRRKYIVADTPGHEQYTRNMVTGASTANLAIILIDARHGVRTQTRRHAYIAHLLGIRHIVVAVNKMDLVDHAQSRFEAIRADYQTFAASLGMGAAEAAQFIPMSALTGDMVVERGERLAWYEGPTLFEALESAPSAHSESDERLRFPVQYVCRPQSREFPDFRGYMGRIESGGMAIGDPVTVLPGGQRTRIRSILAGMQAQPRAIAEQSVTVLLEEEIDISRGDMIVREGQEPRTVKELEATVCWLGEVPLDPRRTYILRHTTRETRVRFGGTAQRIDLTSLTQSPAETLACNDIARVSLSLAQPLFIDAYAENRGTGAFIVIDEASNNTVGAGMIL